MLDSNHSLCGPGPKNFAMCAPTRQPIRLCTLYCHSILDEHSKASVRVNSKVFPVESLARSPMMLYILYIAAAAAFLACVRVCVRACVRV